MTTIAINRGPGDRPDIDGYGEFEMDLEAVLKEQLPRFFDGIAAAPLTPENVQAIPARAKGAYLLLHRGFPVYAGKTDSRHGFQDRLGRHAFTIQHRHNLTVEDISFKATRIMVFSNFDLEAILIERLRAADERNLEWNYSGFGSNDPGEKREDQEPAQFDVDYPINVDREIEFDFSGERSVRDLLVLMKDRLPYTFRFETDGRRVRYTVGHAEQREARIRLPQGPLTARGILQEVVGALPPGWQATIFPGRVILYRERTDYDYALDTIR